MPETYILHDSDDMMMFSQNYKPDKLYLLNYWLSDIANISKEELNFNGIDTLNKTELKLQLNDTPVNVQFCQSNIVQENKILQFLLDQPAAQTGRMSVVFFDIFRFIHSIKIKDQNFLIENMSIQDFFKKSLDVRGLAKYDLGVEEVRSYLFLFRYGPD